MAISDAGEDVSGGFKLKDADLIGVSKQIIVSEKLLEKNIVEYKTRADGKIEETSLKEVIDKIL
jgi:prolyl-tRNA synthetase